MASDSHARAAMNNLHCTIILNWISSLVMPGESFMGINVVSVDKEVLTDYGCRVLEAAGVPRDEAAFVTECLVENDLKGYSTHGIVRVLRYVPSFKEGRTQTFGKAGVKIKVLRETPATTVVDGCGGIGFTVARQAMKLTIEKANRVGIATTGVQNTGHIGRVGTWAEMALVHEMIGVALQGGEAFTVPWGGIERKMPPNPISVAIPTGRGNPFVMDTCIAPASFGKMVFMAQKGEELPPGWLLDKDGNPTRDPSGVMRGEGAMLPLGQEGLGYKGYALTFALSVLSGSLIGSYDYELHRPVYGGVFLAAIDIAAFTPLDEFKRSMDDMVADVKSTRLAEGFDRIRIPGEGAREREERALKEGVSLQVKGMWSWGRLMELAQELGVDTSAYKMDGTHVTLDR